MKREIRDLQYEAIHTFFGLSYASYLVVPRVVLQSMPDEWQEKFVNLLMEMNETFDWMPDDATYKVELRKEDEDLKGNFKWGKVVPDPNVDYHRGRRKLIPISSPRNK